MSWDDQRPWLCFGFFFSSRRRHTRWPRDWSSDVCSSDLSEPPRAAGVTGWGRGTGILYPDPNGGNATIDARKVSRCETELEIGRASWREREENRGGATTRKRKTGNTEEAE